MLEREFLVLAHQETATSKSHWVSSKTLSSLSASIRLCLSTKPLLHGDSAAVVWMTIPKLLHMLVNVLLANSPPLSVRNLPSDPNANILLLKMYLMIVSGCLFGMRVDAGSLVQWSTIMSENFTFIVLTIHCHSFQKCVWHWKTNGLGGGFLYILHGRHDLETSFTSFISLFGLCYGYCVVYTACYEWNFLSKGIGDIILKIGSHLGFLHRWFWQK